MMRNSILTEEAYYSAVAEVCGIPFLPVGSFRPLLVNGHVLQCGPGEAGPMMIGLGRGDRSMWLRRNLSTCPNCALSFCATRTGVQPCALPHLLPCATL